MAYVTPAIMLTYYDNRILGDLCSDVNVRVTPTGLLTDPNLAQAISTGAGIINAAILVGQRYTITQVMALTGDDAALIQWLNAALAYCRLRSRRATKYDDIQDCKDAAAMITALENGQAVLNIAANLEAGLPQSGFPSLTIYAQTNLMRDHANRYFPQRPLQLPTLPESPGSVN